MSEKDMLVVHVDDEVKKSAEKILLDMGLSLNAAINLYLLRVTEEGGIPFDLMADCLYNESNFLHRAAEFQNGERLEMVSAEELIATEP